MRRTGTAWLLAGLAGLGCSQNFERGDVNPPPRVAMPANPHVTTAPQAPAKGMTSLAERTYGKTQTPLATVEKSVSGTVTISPDLASRVPAGATLFVQAKERPGGGAPYAVLRIPVPSFPYRFSLSQADVLPMFGEGLKFADIDEMYIVAKIDQDGAVGPPDSGDMDGATKVPVKPGQKDVEVVIDKVH